MAQNTNRSGDASAQDDFTGIGDRLVSGLAAAFPDLHEDVEEDGVPAEEALLADRIASDVSDLEIRRGRSTLRQGFQTSHLLSASAIDTRTGETVGQAGAWFIRNDAAFRGRQWEVEQVTHGMVSGTFSTMAEAHEAVVAAARAMAAASLVRAAQDLSTDGAQAPSADQSTTSTEQGEAQVADADIVINGLPTMVINAEMATNILTLMAGDETRGVEVWFEVADPTEDDREWAGMVANYDPSDLDDQPSEGETYWLTGYTPWFAHPDSSCPECIHGPMWHAEQSGCTRMNGPWCYCERVYAPDASGPNDFQSAEQVVHDLNHGDASDIECMLCRALFDSTTDADGNAIPVGPGMVLTVDTNDMAQVREALGHLQSIVDLESSKAMAARWAAIDWDALVWVPSTYPGLDSVARLTTDLWDCPSCSEDSGWVEQVFAHREVDGTITVRPLCGHCGYEPTLSQTGEDLD